MDETISAAQANREFSRLRGGLEDHSYVVTGHGHPAARLVPATNDKDMKEAAREQLFARLRSQSVLNAGRWTCDELYDG